MSSSATPKITLPGAAKATVAKTAAVAGDKATAARIVKPGSERYKAQELIVEHELIADCEARGDERHIRENVRTMYHWLNAKADEMRADAKGQLSDEQKEAARKRDEFELRRIQSNCHQAQLNCKRTVLVRKANERQAAQYKRLIDQIKKHTEEAAVQVTECKRELVVARLEKKQRQEYDVLAKLILRYPDRDDLERKMAIVTEEIRVAEERRAALEAKLALAKKKFYTLGCLLQSLLEDHELDRDDLMREIDADAARSHLQLDELPDPRMEEATREEPSSQASTDSELMEDDSKEGSTDKAKASEPEVFGPKAPKLTALAGEVADENSMDTS